MAEEEVLDKSERDTEPRSPEEEAEEFAPGELCACDAVTDEDVVDLGEEDDSGLGEEEKEHILEELANKAAQRDLTSYRLEIRDAWKARYFYRGNQYLLPGRNGAWVLPQLVLVGGQSYDDHNQETNIYLAFADTIIAALTAGTPSVRFEPDDPTNPADVGAAESADDARRLIERANDMIVLQEDIVRFLWTDGRSMVYTHYVLDGQRFGYEHQNAIEDELKYLPEMVATGTKPVATVPPPKEEEGEESFGRGEPRGQEVIECGGALEWKVPIQAKDIHGCDYALRSQEFDITLMRTKYPEKAEELQPMQTATANTEYARLARTSIMTGMRPSNMTNDAMTYQATEMLGWFRPSFYTEIAKGPKRDWLYDTFPKGAMVAMVGKRVVEARRESMDDHLTLIHARPGDGMHRPALGGPLIPLQEKLNDCMDYTHDAFMHLVPLKFVDNESIDVDALQQLQSKANQYVKMKRKPDKDMASNIFVEPQIQLAEGLLEYIQWLFGEFSQFLCGAFPALFGGNTKQNDTASGIASQRDQALGRIGLTWRNIKAGYARIIRQAVAAAAKFRNSPMSGEIPGAGGEKTKLAIDPEDLKGNVRCFPDTDENFPESWVAQRAVWQAVMAAAATNPLLAAVLQVPRNMAIAKDKIGIPELVIPPAVAASKQQAETMVLLEGAPVPNPQLEKAKQGIANNPPPEGTPPQVLQAVQQQIAQALAQIPELVSSVPVDEELDDHINEMGEIKTFCSTPEGIAARVDKPDGFANLRLHYDEHKRALQALQAQAQPQNPKPPSESMNFKDLPVDGKVQMAAQSGIKLNPALLAAQEQKNQAMETAKPGGVGGLPPSGAGPQPSPPAVQ